MSVVWSKLPVQKVGWNTVDPACAKRGAKTLHCVSAGGCGLRQNCFIARDAVALGTA